ncbi:hypothetical protein A5685_03285 [Mycobacterium colombiense]|uniref:DUF2637 domain-containing protein n=1 Tax=Mycobacterium colombiense TaxID=339268 RepID=A0A1A2S6U7_9MYCO|nr:DUF2637 domain-containing protein [Mycobacterium colombiense]OBH59477.1 hypothetical protein A5685_03285 [Mycobacterium colombiense]
MTGQAEINRNHNRAVRFFWGLLIGATAISLLGNVAHALLPYLPRVCVQIVGATVPPIALLSAVHGIALAVRAGASGRVYCSAVSAVAAIGLGAFAVSFLALRDLMRVIGYSAATAWIFPAIIDTAVAVSTLMLVALGDKPARRVRKMGRSVSAQPSTVQTVADLPATGTKAEVKPSVTTGLGTPLVTAERMQTTMPLGLTSTQTVQASLQTEAAQVDANLASELIASGATTQPVATVIAVLAAIRDGASINAAAKASRINYRTAQRIVQAGADHRQRQLAVVG